jgi:hypothetical protein
MFYTQPPTAAERAQSPTEYTDSGARSGTQLLPTRKPHPFQQEVKRRLWTMRSQKLLEEIRLFQTYVSQGLR